MKSKALVLKQKGESKHAFELQDIHLPDIKEDEVLIESEAFGLNYADVMARNGLYRDAPEMPCVIGYEAVGIVIEVGSKSNQKILGKRVLAFCRFGGYGRHIITKSEATVLIDDLPSQEVLALSTQAVTAYYMTDVLSPVSKGDRVLVHAAAGGVGTILIQLAKRKGAIVIAKVGTREKEEVVRQFGADHVINYRDSNYEEEVKSFLDGKPLDISYNPVGGTTFRKDMKLIGAGGRLFIFGGSELSGGKFGFLSSINFLRKMGIIIPAGLMMTSKSILGVNMLKIADHRPEVMRESLKKLIGWYRNGELQICVGGVFDVDKISEAHDLLEGGKSKGKISVRWV
jgi:NADPH2:quinone reductase